MDWFELSVRTRMFKKEEELEQAGHYHYLRGYGQLPTYDNVSPALDDPLDPRWLSSRANRDAGLDVGRFTVRSTRKTLYWDMWISKQLWANGVDIRSEDWRSAQLATALSLSRFQTARTRQLFRQIHKKLPAEIRLAIYGFIAPVRFATISDGIMHQRRHFRNPDTPYSSQVTNDYVVPREVGWCLPEHAILGNLYFEWVHDWYKRMWFRVGGDHLIDGFLSFDYGDASYAPSRAVQHLFLSVQYTCKGTDANLATRLHCLASLKLHDASTLSIDIEKAVPTIKRCYYNGRSYRVLPEYIQYSLDWLHDDSPEHDQRLHCVLTVLSILDSKFDRSLLRIFGSRGNWCWMATVGQCRAYFQGYIQQW